LLLLLLCCAVASLSLSLSLSLVLVLWRHVEYLSFYISLINISRVLRIARIFHLEAYIHSEVARSFFKVMFTVILLLFTTAGLVQSVENDAYCSSVVTKATPASIMCEDYEYLFSAYFDKAQNCEIIYNKSFRSNGKACFQRYTFFECMYFCVVTICTVGYGDMAPKSSAGMLIVSLFIIVAIVTVPIITGKCVEAMNLQNSYQRDSYRSGENGPMDHVLVCGCVSEKGVRTFFSEFYHEDNSLAGEPYRTVILSPRPPSHEMLELMKSPLQFFITYLQGHCMRDSDLYRANVHNAKACFVLANKHSNRTSDTEDATAIMQALNIKRFVARASPGRSIFMLIQLLRPENKDHLLGTSTEELALQSQASDDRKVVTLPNRNVLSPPRFVLILFSSFRLVCRLFLCGTTNKKAKHDHSVPGRELYLSGSDFVDCLDETKLHLLAKGCICPGLMSLISNLSSSGIEVGSFACARTDSLALFPSFHIYPRIFLFRQHIPCSRSF
jgi:hypothetical protein